MTMPEEYKDKRQHGRDEYIPEVKCGSCEEWLPRDEAIKKEGLYFHKECIK